MNRRPGFTLFEVLISLALCLVLLTAVYASLQVYARFSTAGREQIERVQLSRAILRRMEVDVNSVVFRVPEEETEEGQAADSGTSSGSSGGSSSGSGSSSSGSGGQSGGSSGQGGSSGGSGGSGTQNSGSSSGASGSQNSQSGGNSSSSSTTESETEIAIEDPTQAYTATSVGIIGDGGNLVVHVSRPSRDLSYSAVVDADSVTSRTSDLQSISYFLAAPGGAGLQGAVGQSAGAGLARLEGDRFAIDHADAQADIAALAAEANVIAPEIVGLQFRYFDGTQWYDSWNSVTEAALPQAIEVTLAFQSLDAVAPRDTALLTTAADATLAPSVRYVIAVPLATPPALQQEAVQ